MSDLKKAERLYRDFTKWRQLKGDGKPGGWKKLLPDQRESWKRLVEFLRERT